MKLQYPAIAIIFFARVRIAPRVLVENAREVRVSGEESRHTKAYLSRVAKVPGLPCFSLSIDFPAVANLHDENNQAGILDPRDDAPVSDTVFPQVAQPLALYGLANASRIIKRGHAIG